MGTFLFNIEAQVAKPLELIYDQFFDLKKFGALHPLMNEVKIHEDKRPDFIEYEIKETAYLLGFIKMHPVYKAKVFELKKNHSLQYTTQIKKDVHLTLNFSFRHSPETGTTSIKETAELKAGRFVAAIFLPMLKKNHLIVMEKLQTI
jgi:hypothetical protein